MSHAAAHISGRFFPLTSLLLFVALFLTSSICLPTPLSPLFSCLIAIIYSVMFTFRNGESLNKKIELFVKGSSHPTIISMGYIFIFSAIFTYILKLIGSIDTAITLGMQLIPSQYLLPGFFAIASIFATAIGSSMGTIAAFMPIGIGIAYDLGIEPALMAGIVVSGAMLGDNLSIISDTTIAATQTVGAKMADKFKTNLLLVIPAFLLTIITLSYSNHIINHTDHLPIQELTTSDLVTIIPYILIFLLAVSGIDVIAVLVIGILSAIGVGVWQGTFSFMYGASLILEGFTSNPGIQEVLILVLFIGGLSHLVEYNGGIDFLLYHMDKRVKSKAQAEVSIVILTTLINACVAINTIAILITGPVAKHIASQFKIEKKRTASLLDIAACTCQGILPYAAQLLLAGSLAGIPSISIIPYLYYQGFSFLIMAGSIGYTFFRNR